MINNKRKAGVFLFSFGMLLILCAAVLCCINIYSIEKAEKASDNIAAKFEEQLLLNESAEHDNDEPLPPTELIINGKSYIGILSIPSLDLQLPIRSELSYSELVESPCCYHGGIKSGDLVIAAHNYPSHFRYLHRLSNDEYVYFTDAVGCVTKYAVIQTEILAPDEVERMTNGEYDMTLFTCTPGGGARLTVRCMQV